MHAKGLLSEYQPKYNSARAVYRERKKYVHEIDWNLVAVPPSGSLKEELQWTAWKRFLAFEKENPQRIDSVSANKRISFTYEQCLMYLHHYPDIWFDYATWHAKSGSIDFAIKVYKRSLKALPGFSNLTELGLKRNDIAAKGMSAVSNFVNLLKLDLETHSLSP